MSIYPTDANMNDPSTFNLSRNTYSECRCKSISAGRVSERIDAVHRYGTFLVLRPDSSSEVVLHNISNVVREIVNPPDKDSFKATLKGLFHVTVASPLPPMNRNEVKEFMKAIAKSLSYQDALKYNLRLVSGEEANYTFSFGSSDGNPYVTLKMFSNQPPITPEGKIPAAIVFPHVLKLSNKVNKIFEEKYGEKVSKTFKPHVTLGRFSEDKSSGKRVHIMNCHQKNKKMALASAVGELYQAKKTLVFPTLELLQIDKMVGEKHPGYATLATFNLATKKIKYFEIPPCQHEATGLKVNSPTKILNSPLPPETESTDASSINDLDPSIQLGQAIARIIGRLPKFIDESKDQYGHFTFKVGFDQLQDAEKLVGKIGSGTIRKNGNNDHYVQMGKVRCKILLGESLGERIFKRASKDIGLK